MGILLFFFYALDETVHCVKGDHRSDAISEFSLHMVEGWLVAVLITFLVFHILCSRLMSSDGIFRNDGVEERYSVLIKLA